MTMLAVQSFLLILAAFFAGAMIACVFRRVFFVRDNEGPSPDGGRGTTKKSADVVTTTTTETTTTVSSEETERFGRALKGDDPPASAAASVVVDEAESRTTPLSSATPAHFSHDDLTRIRSINRQLVARLHDAGVTTFAQIAAWQPNDVARINQTLGFVGRIEKENWVEQAKIIRQGGESAAAIVPPVVVSGADHILEKEESAESVKDKRPIGATSTETLAKPSAVDRSATMTEPSQPRGVAVQSMHPTSAPNVSALRSVRSEALVGGETTDESNVVALPTLGHRSNDDLKRIRGIGVLIEKRLNAMGVRTYAQVANWTASDVAQVSRSLDFKGRIEREGWIEQARILSSGGHTEFSRRSS